MEDNQEIQPVPMIFAEDSITFGLNENSFKDFMVGLLGKPEQIEGYVEGAFEVNVTNLQDLYSKIDNRVIRQHDALLLEFKAELFFDDDSSIMFNTIGNLISHQETRSVVCTGFNFTWSYLVTFSKGKPPERQEISVFANTDYGKKRKKHRSLILSLLSNTDLEVPKVNYSIRCTEKTWGSDLTEIIKAALKANIVRGSFLLNFRSSLIQVSITLFYFIWMLVWFNIVDKVKAVQGRELLNLDGFLGNSVDNSIKLDRLLVMARENLFPSNSYFMPTMVISFIVVGLSYSHSHSSGIQS
ncbi:hypothetical protein DO97_13245 [Neosynechococcus sphagnicola sy1]|uniref:Uncharacterized protein n=1 Tax=Neosynechococcus sphagnicola sy1 TaxID=1497020 RepID=A0A098TIY1_9CYAN|nr:hypothetical protein [Neosynechococcus sphagnicola]KGF72001.1 hypothetical protein DO97_13245 [Neosynechococcus sphagnicola sy1]